jgi:hypothetical protein
MEHPCRLSHQQEVSATSLLELFCSVDDLWINDAPSLQQLSIPASAAVQFLVNLFAGLIAYCLQPEKPSLGRRLHGLVLA